MHFSLTFISIISVLAGRVSSATYDIDSNITGISFYEDFSFQQIADPTNGRVNYVDEPTALANNLTYANEDTFILRSDFTTVLAPTGPGRQSVRLMSNKQWSTSVIVLDISHMPEGCGTWPAVWTVGTDWPNNGEVDIIEGVNNVMPNQSTLHTAPGCSMPSSGVGQTGTIVSTDCNAFDASNTGCGTKAPSPNSFGPNFNTNGGGWYAMERTTDSIQVWFWERDSSDVPDAVVSGCSKIDTSTFGIPYANFVNTQCNIPQHFGDHNIVINLTFCGDFAGDAAVYGASGCPSTCPSFVEQNPSAFENAFFDINALRVYT